jgi:hypothetical protein
MQYSGIKLLPIKVPVNSCGARPAILAEIKQKVALLPQKK